MSLPDHYPSRNYLTQLQHDRLVTLRKLASEGAHKVDAMEALGISKRALNSFLVAMLGSYVWPPKIDDALFSLPVRDGYEMRTIRHKRSTSAVINRISEADIARRVAEDQARRDAPRIAALLAERERYNLPRVGRLIDEMAA